MPTESANAKLATLGTNVMSVRTITLVTHHAKVRKPRKSNFLFRNNYIFTLLKLEACECDRKGSSTLQCLSDGKCSCKSGYNSTKCDNCAVNFYKNSDGECEGKEYLKLFYQASID